MKNWTEYVDAYRLSVNSEYSFLKRNHPECLLNKNIRTKYKCGDGTEKNCMYKGALIAHGTLRWAFEWFSSGDTR